ncbi:Uncharacterised protein [Campylobacter ureolyticus]|uniref:Transposase n=1 Tax=Campylobacter ureolyticus TaxID=827 RepID=A0A6N2SJW0_9BACT
MTISSAELEIVKQLFSTLSNDDKKSFLKSIKNKEKSEQNFTLLREIKECPHCKSTHFKKNGTTYGKQRYICNDCKKPLLSQMILYFLVLKKTYLYGENIYIV